VSKQLIFQHLPYKKTHRLLQTRTYIILDHKSTKY